MLHRLPPLPAALLLACGAAAPPIGVVAPLSAQSPTIPAGSREVVGTVTGAAGMPLADVVVGVLGPAGQTPATVRTSERGRFRIVVPAGPATLTVRAIGYRRQTVRVETDARAIDVALEKDVLQLEQVVVSGQATTTERRNATTAIATVAGDELTRAPAPSLESALQGKVVGANINMNSGAPGGGGQVQIRGVTSILGQGEPLYVVDGVIVSNATTSPGTNAITRASPGASAPISTTNNTTAGQDNGANRLADLNPAEIESVEILKSAAATAIYGSRASNGVVVIRTKRGAPGATRFTLLQRVGTQEPLRLVGQRRYTSLDQALGAVRTRADSARVNTLFADGVPAFSDFQRELYDNRAPSYETMLSASGGSDATTFRTSYTQRVEQGTLRNTEARLQALRVNLDQRVGDRVTAQASVGLTRNLLRRGVSNNDNVGASPIYVFGYTPSYVNLAARNEAGAYPDNPFRPGNPFQTMDLLRADDDTWRGVASANVTLRALTRGAHQLDFTALGGVDRFQNEGELNSPATLQYERLTAQPGTVVQSNTSSQSLNGQVSARWTFTPLSLPFTAVTELGASDEQQYQDVYRLRGRGGLPGVPRTDRGQGDQFEQYLWFHDQAAYLNTQISAFGERLNLSGGVRADRSSANGDPSEFYLFPRVAGAYRLGGISALDEVKLRVAYGQTGNRPRYGDRDLLLASVGVIDGRTTLIRNATVGNRTIRPETLHELEYGLDASFLGQRLALEATAYDRTITDQLLQPTTAPSSGYTQLVVNAGELRNRGVELALTAVPVQTRSLSWTARASYQRSVQTVENLPPEVPPFNAPNSFGPQYGRVRIAEGARTTAIWGNAPVRRVDGQLTEILPIGVYVTRPAPTSGRDTIVVRDTIIGDANPDFQAFFSNTLTYKRLSLSVLVDWRHGGDVANMTNNLYDEGRQSRDFDAPAPVDAETLARFPGMTLGAYRYRAWNAGNDARVYIEDGSYVKLREIALAYDLPTGIVSRLGSRVSSARLTAQARNLAMWTNYWGADPEVSNFGNQNLNRFIDLAPYPPSRQFSLGVILGF